MLEPVNHQSSVDNIPTMLRTGRTVLPKQNVTRRCLSTEKGDVGLILADGSRR
jgi:hypothetical protein